MEIISVRVGSHSQTPAVNIENPSQVNATLENINIQTGGGTDTSDATAVAEDIMKDKTAYVGLGKVTGTFTLNSEISSQNTLIANIKEALKGKAASGGGSPAEYTRVDCVKFTGDQIVDTGIICTQDSKIRILYTKDSSDAMYMYGVVNSDNTASVTAYMTSGGGSWRFGNKYSAKAITSNEELVHTAIVTKNSIIRGEHIASLSSVNEFETIGTLLIGAVRNADGSVANAQFIGKVLCFEIWQGEEQVLKLVPVVNKDGVYGFYDEISETFFESITDTPLGGGNF